ncbi:MAG: hypothetical protein GXO49_05155 [Chlorobi bacterium]|nr:hypothetical protein [Chlorobiota bacterium]
MVKIDCTKFLTEDRKITKELINCYKGYAFSIIKKVNKAFDKHELESIHYEALLSFIEKVDISKSKGEIDAYFKRILENKAINKMRSKEGLETPTYWPKVNLPETDNNPTIETFGKKNKGDKSSKKKEIIRLKLENNTLKKIAGIDESPEEAFIKKEKRKKSESIVNKFKIAYRNYENYSIDALIRNYFYFHADFEKVLQNEEIKEFKTPKVPGDFNFSKSISSIQVRYMHWHNKSTIEDRKWCKVAIDVMDESKTENGRDEAEVPKMGAVVLDKNGNFLGKSARESDGHAEYHLLEKVLKDEDLTGGTIYVTLEPCIRRSEGKIPCAKRIVQRGLKRVVIAMYDPNDDKERGVDGEGVKYLKENGLEVSWFDPDLATIVEEKNRKFLKRHINKRKN